MNSHFDRDLNPKRPFRSMATRMDERGTLEAKRILARRRMQERKPERLPAMRAFTFMGMVRI